MRKVIDISEIDIATVTDPKLQAILIALFTDAYIEPDELPDGFLNRGWWGDDIELKVNNNKERKIWGSKLWLLERFKLNDDVLGEVKTWVKEALSILIDSGVIAEPEISVMRGDDKLMLCLTFENEQIEFKGF